MRVRDYDTMYNENTGGTETHPATDEMIKQTIDQPGIHRRAFEEGFAAASGVRGETAETGGRVHAPELDDRSTIESLPSSLDDENAGLADN